MRDLVVEKASPYAFFLIMAWSMDVPRNIIRGVLYEMCMNFCLFFGQLASFFH